MNTPNGLADPDSAAALLGKVARKVKKKFGRLDIPWGNVMRISDDIPGTGAPGDPLGVYHVLEYKPSNSGKYRPVFGDTWSAVIEFSDSGPEAKVLMAYGNASESQSGIKNDQLNLLSNKDMRQLWYSRELVEENLKNRTLYRYHK